jgi:FkbM family methyltransferase
MRKIKLYILLWLNFIKIATIINWRHLFVFYFPFYWRNPAKLTGIRIHRLGNQKIYIRRGSLIDRDVVKYVFYDQFHLPSRQLPSNPVILDLGSNIGLTALHFKLQYPGSRIIGYEMDTANCIIARQNCSDLTNCIIHNEAIWPVTGQVVYNTSQYEDGYAVAETAIANGSPQKAKAITLQDVWLQHQLSSVDYLKMDIEGAEKNVFLSGNLTWLNQVLELNIECHDDDFLDRALSLIASYGFKTWRDEAHFCMLRAVKKQDEPIAHTIRPV